MSTRTFSMFKFAALGAIALVSVLVVSSLASAAVSPTVTGTVRSSGGSVITSADAGDSVYARVEVASTSATTSPTGTVDFSWYAGTSCSNSATTTQSNVALIDGIASSSLIQVPIGGLSFKAHYDGQTDVYNEADSSCVSVSANQINPQDTALSLSLSDNNITAGDSVHAIPSLTGETSGADGSIAFKVWSDNSCTNLALNAGSKTVTDSTTQNSDSWQFITPGTYYWQGAYSGDAENDAATSSCTGAVLTVVATSTGTTTPPETGENTISGTVFNDLNKNDVQNGSEPGLSGWTVWLHKQDSNTNLLGKLLKKIKKHDFYDDPIVATVTTDGSGNYSFGNLGAGTYFVEEDEKSGWNQTSDDKKVVLSSSKTSADVDFANVEKGNRNNDNDDEDNDNGHHNGHATSTDNGGHDNGDKDHGKGNRGDDNDDDDNGTSTDNGNNGNHRGWFKFDVKNWSNIWNHPKAK